MMKPHSFSQSENGVTRHMRDQTGRHNYHVFQDDEIVNNYNIKHLNRLVHGPNISALNIRTSTTCSTLHHCSKGVNHARTPECFGQALHQNYCPCWEYSETHGWYRCGQQQMVMSVGCKKHRDDEMRKVLEKIRKGYLVYGWS
jgi:hypothetical protein